MPGADPGPLPTDIVITGLGAVTPFGWGVGPLWEGLRRGATAIGPFSRFDASRHRTHLAAEVPERPSPDRLGPRVSLADRLAVASAREALGHADLDLRRCPERAGVFFGSSNGGMLESERFLEAALRDGRRRARTSAIVSQQLNGPGDAVARALRVEGPVETVSSACTSGAMAIGGALRALRRGEIDVALAGGADSLCQITYAGFNALRSVDEAACRPFRADRAGLSLGEGAAVLVLETGAAARARGARPIAVLAGEASACDAHHMTAPAPDGAGAAEAIRMALADAGRTADDVDFVNAHGTGTPLNDAAEAAALHAVFGPRTGSIPVTSTKALIGHLLGSAGAIEALATVLCLVRRELHPMPAAGTLDPAIGLDLVIASPRPLRRSRCALSTNLAFGGSNAALVFTSAGRA
ncbi:MAG TPA: beta-ketoacyl-[acyl-carrier-protein] synthase family protein [Candidatus Polarisedimenticolaceae bacterium]|nr:beta-ketoacyl-[acyl-carrier-protein] synthase family protein [Candidatus Polarisedimenticolaceae bacterium]